MKYSSASGDTNLDGVVVHETMFGAEMAQETVASDEGPRAFRARYRRFLMAVNEIAINDLDGCGLASQSIENQCLTRT